MECSDTDLLNQFRSTGERRFLDELLDRHLARVRGLVFQIVLDHSAADDVTQEIFLRVIRSLDRFEGRSSFGTWLYAISMNCVRSHLRRIDRHESTVQTLSDTDLSPAVSAPSEGGLLQRELKTEIQHALKQLTPPLRTAIVLVCLQDLSPEEAAQIENCSTKTMHWRVHEARRRMKQLLAEHMA